MRILKENTIGVLIDVQERLFPHIDAHEELSKNTEILLKGLKSIEIPVIVTQQYTKALGETIEPLKQILCTTNEIEKIAFSCCDEPVFMDEIKRQNKKNVIIAGIESHICVLQTVVDLVNDGFQPIVVVDCVSSRKAKDKEIALRRIEKEGGILTTYESILFELCRYAKSDAFKTISKLVK